MRALSKLLISIFVVLFTMSSAYSNSETFTGKWSGEGTYILDGDINHCTEFEMSFVATVDTFTFSNGYRVCGQINETFYEVTMDLKEGLLYMGSMVVGSYDGTVLTAEFSAPDGDGTRHWRMTARRQGDQLMYEESRRMNDNRTPLINFAGLLIRQVN